MKKTILLLFIATLSFYGRAQTTLDKKFSDAMENNLKILDTANTGTTLTLLANNFERIARTEKKYWQPWYYAALCYGFMAADVADKTLIDPLTDKANEYLQKAIALSSANSEISTLQGMISNTKILADPVARWRTYSVEAAAFLETAKKQNPANPRPYLVEARTKLFTPSNLGGGTEAAKPLAEKALSNFAVFIPENSIAPRWGQAQAQWLVNRVSSGKN